LNDAEVHLQWADLRAWRSPGGFQRAQADLAEAEARLPGSPECAYWRARFAAVTGSGPAPAPLLRGLVSARLNQPRYWAALAELLLEEQRQAALSPTRELDRVAAQLATLARTATAWRLVAEYQLLKAGPQPAAAGAGVDAARRALALDSSCWRCADVLGALLHRAGRLEDAIEATQLAVRLVPDSSLEASAAMRERLEHYRQQLGAPQPVGTPAPFRAR
jgi:hypothetical protein